MSEAAHIVPASKDACPGGKTFSVQFKSCSATDFPDKGCVQELEACKNSLAYVDDLIFQKTGEVMPPTAVALVSMVWPHCNFSRWCIQLCKHMHTSLSSACDAKEQEMDAVDQSSSSYLE